MTLPNVGRPPTAKIPAIEDAIIAVSKRMKRTSSRDIAREMGEATARLLEVLIDSKLEL
jgi:hypothetical protein